MNKEALINLVFEGFSLSEAQGILEAKITPENAKDFVNSPVYKNLERAAGEMLKDLESSEEYKRGKFTDDPIQSLYDEADNCEYAYHMLNGLDISSFSPDVKSKASKIVSTLKNSANAIRKKLATLKKSDFIGDDGQLKMKVKTDKDGNIEYTKGKVDKDGSVVEPARPKYVRDYPYDQNTYNGRALDGLTNFFKLIGIPWFYDYRWNNYINDPSRGSKREIDYKVPESVKKDINTVILKSKDKGFFDKEKLKESLCLTKSESIYFDMIWDKEVD